MRAVPSSLVEAIEQRLRTRRVHGLALVAFDRDGIRFGGGVGFADLDRGERVGTDTVFRVASVSKQLTTTVALRAVDDGLLDLDGLVNDRLPSGQQVLDADGRPAPITLRSLLSHTSGLPSSVRGIDLGHRLLTRLVNGPPARTLTEAVTGLRTVRPVGERIVYANSGLNLAGYLAALAYGNSFEAVAQKQVLGPLGMERSAFTTRRSGPGVATPYGSLTPPAVGSRPAAALQLRATPMGGLTTTAEDLARFGRMVLGGGVLDGARLLSGELVAVATALGARNHPDLEQGFGLGFKARTWRGQRLVGHDGNMPGVASSVWMAPDEGVGVVVLTNGFALGIPHEVAQLALAELVDAPQEASAAGDGGAQEDGPSAADAEAFAGRVVGRYAIESVAPPGIVGTLARLTTKIVIRHEAEGLLRVDGNPAADGPMWLRPEGHLGHYRIAAAVDHGTNAVVDDGPDGFRIWAAHSTLLRRTSTG